MMLTAKSYAHFLLNRFFILESKAKWGCVPDSKLFTRFIGFFTVLVFEIRFLAWVYCEKDRISSQAPSPRRGL